MDGDLVLATKTPHKLYRPITLSTNENKNKTMLKNFNMFISKRQLLIIFVINCITSALRTIVNSTPIVVSNIAVLLSQFEIKLMFRYNI